MFQSVEIGLLHLLMFNCFTSFELAPIKLIKPEVTRLHPWIKGHYVTIFNISRADPPCHMSLIFL